MSRKAAQTGPGAMVLVAIEQAFSKDERIIDDDLAKPILPLSFRVNVWISTRVKDWLIRKTEERVPGLWGGIMARKRYIDEIVTK
ncbi:MAG: class I SAM-dependent methyltransferase, partial [Thermoanaerobaculales bacterium]|nr:class I SAM-dependent methyltransferase [Thermoanaerobaculales bacterium]